MRKLIFLLIPCVLALSGCGSDGGNPLSSLGLMASKKEPIDYSPRPPLAIPPEEQRSQLPPPQYEGQPPLAPSQTQDVVVAPPATYATPAPQSENPQSAEDKPWWERIFGS